MSSKKQAGTRQFRDIQPGVLLGNAPVKCDSGSLVNAASTSQRRVLVHSPQDKTVLISQREVLVSRSIDKLVSPSHTLACAYHAHISANQSYVKERIQ